MGPDIAGPTLHTEVIQADMFRANSARHPASGVSLRRGNADGGATMLPNLLKHLENALFIKVLVISVELKSKQGQRLDMLD